MSEDLRESASDVDITRVYGLSKNLRLGRLFVLVSKLEGNFKMSMYHIKKSAALEPRSIL